MMVEGCVDGAKGTPEGEDVVETAGCDTGGSHDGFRTGAGGLARSGESQPQEGGHLECFI